MRDILKVEGLTKTFQLSSRQQKIEHTHEAKRVAADHVSFSAYEGEIFGLLGPNGAGKTTTLRMLATLIKPDSGDAWINGYSIVDQPDQVRKNIGFLTSELKLEEYFTPDYLFDFFSTLHNIDPQEAQARKKAIFERFGVDRFAFVKIADLSTGMKQKVSLIISIVHDPDIIIFDEPTNGLDVITAKIVTDYLLELRDQGKSLVISTHIFSLVEKLCDRIGIIIGGKMVACDTLANITQGVDLENHFFTLYRDVMGEIA